MIKFDASALVPIGIIYLSLFFDFFLLEGFVIVHPTLSEEHGWEDATLTPMLAICKFSMMLTCPLVALASARLAAHTILIIGITFLAASTLCLSFSHSIGMFALAKVAHGIASPSLTLSSMSILTYLAEETTRGQYASYGYTAISHGLLVAPFLTGIMLDRLGQFWAYMIIFAIVAATLAGAVVHFYDVSLIPCPRREKPRAECLSHKSIEGEEAPIKKDIKVFEPINREQLIMLIKTLMTNPYMLTAVTSCFLVGLSVGSNESVLPVILKSTQRELDMSESSVDLIWTGGSVAYMLFATSTGFFADRIPPIRLVWGGMVGFIVTFLFMSPVCSSLVGMISFIALTGALTSFLDVAAYPLITSVVDTANIPNAYIIGYSIEYCLEQAGYAIGQYSGGPLFEYAQSLAPVAYLVAGVDSLLLLFTMVVMFVYPKDRFVIKKSIDDESDKEVCIEEGMIHEQQ